MDSKRLEKTLNTNMLLMAGFSHVSNDLEELKSLVRKRVPYFKTEDAINSFRQHIEVSHKKPRNYFYILEQFELRFRGKNIAIIPAVEIESFLFSRWKGTTLGKRRAQLSAFFSFSIRELKRRGEAVFHNPCELIEIKNVKKSESFVYVGTEKMAELLRSANSEKHWLWMAIPATAGLRVGEMIKLSPENVNERVLMLLTPKSGRDEEIAVLPTEVTVRLKAYIEANNIAPDEPIWQGKPDALSSTINKTVKRYSSKLGFTYTTHDLRKFCASAWDRLGEYGARRFVLRHSSSADGYIDHLSARYVAPLSTQEMESLQDKYMDFL